MGNSMKPIILNVDMESDRTSRMIFFISTPFDDTLTGKVLNPPEVAFFTRRPSGGFFLDTTMPLIDGIMLVKQILSLV